MRGILIATLRVDCSIRNSWRVARLAENLLIIESMYEFSDWFPTWCSFASRRSIGAARSGTFATPVFVFRWRPDRETRHLNTKFEYADEPRIHQSTSVWTGPCMVIGPARRAGNALDSTRCVSRIEVTPVGLRFASGRFRSKGFNIKPPSFPLTSLPYPVTSERDKKAVYLRRAFRQFVKIKNKSSGFNCDRKKRWRVVDKIEKRKILKVMRIKCVCSSVYVGTAVMEPQGSGFSRRASSPLLSSFRHHHRPTVSSAFSSSRRESLIKWTLRLPLARR